MYTQILKEIFLSIKFDQNHRKQFIAHCRQQYVDNNSQLNNVTELEKDY